MSRRNAADLAINQLHCRAICDEIGERLRYVLKPETEIPARLLALIEKLAELESSPSIVPSIDEMTFRCSREPADRAKPSTDPRPLATNHLLASADP
jgi:hypothetical protein